LTLFGLIVNLASAKVVALGDIGLVTGVAALMGGIITWGHERKQALDNGADRWDWRHSLTLQMVMLGGIVTMFGLIN
jgi:hypothetical protein